MGKMYSLRKKFLFISILVLVNLVLVQVMQHPLITRAAEDNDLISNSQKILDLNGFNAKTSLLNEDEQIYISQRITSGLKRIGFESKLLENNFIVDHNFALKPVKIYDYESGVTNYFFYNQFKDSNGNIVFLQVLYDSDMDNMLQVTAKEVNSVSKEMNDFFEYSEYSTGNNIQTRGFTFNGRSFECSVASLLVCVNFCLAFNLAGPVVGATCDIACGVAFAAVCATW